MAESKNPENNMALDEIIKNDKTGKYKRFRNRRRRNFRSYNGNTGNTGNKKDTRRRIRIENLNKDIQNSELTELFGPFGKLTRCGIRYDKMGASTGNADIEYTTHEECEAAIKKLDNAEINGVAVRVKYASSIRRPSFRRVKSAGAQRRTIRRINRTTGRLGRRNLRRRVMTRRTGTSSSLRNRREGSRKRRVFARTLGRKRVTKRK